MRWLFACLLLLTAAPALACGRDTDCDIPGGAYRIALPDGRVEGVLLFFHGWQGTAASVMKNGSLTGAAAREGLALVAPHGLNKTWSYPGSPDASRDEFAFLDALVADLRDRHGLPVDRILVTGFSMGGSMAWNAACHRGALFAGFAPVAGAYWDPIPESCPSPVPVLLHVHGTADRTVPLAGRPIGAHWRQSDVFASIDRWRSQGGCLADDPDISRTDELSCQRWTRCGGGVIEVCLHDGGHSIRTEWVIRGWQELKRIKGWS